MSTRVDDAQSGAQSGVPAQIGPPGGVPAVAFDPDDRFGGHALPGDHPQWMKDTLSLSQRARALLADLKPVMLRVVRHWEHRVRSIAIGNQRLAVDVSGSYRLE